ncbi:MAG: polysaccharide pyruvyl transferase family protein [Firmicutes bacterium]|nr:polysaccharide pyruvyl transferase family protein [Bacillota bacterium]
MKIGILTYHFSNNNYGAVLQTFASCQILKQLGVQPEVINLLPNKPIGLIEKLKNRTKSFIFNNIQFECFRKRYFDLTKPFYHFDDLKVLNDYFEGFYVGSDQVWRASMANENLSHYFLDFAQDSKIKMSYAASFGIDKWEGTVHDIGFFQKLLHRFNAVSVRENDGVSICKKIFDKKAVSVLDPVLLLEKYHYMRIIKKHKKFNKDSFIAYHLIQDKLATSDFFRDVKNKSELNIINLYGNEKKLFGKSGLRFYSVENWLYGILQAEFIITDSFHCLLFALIFEKNFVCVPNKHGGVSRIKNILKMIGLEHRFISCSEVDLTQLTSQKIDFSKVQKNLYHLKKFSIEYIQHSFKK